MNSSDKPPVPSSESNIFTITSLILHEVAELPEAGGDLVFDRSRGKSLIKWFSGHRVSRQIFEYPSNICRQSFQLSIDIAAVGWMQKIFLQLCGRRPAFKIFMRVYAEQILLCLNICRQDVQSSICGHRIWVSWLSQVLVTRKLCKSQITNRWGSSPIVS